MVKRSLMLLAIAIQSLWVYAEIYTETVDGIEWTYTVTNGGASIGDGNWSSVPATTSGIITIPSTLGGNSVVGINDSAFETCKLLEKIIIPEGVRSIGYGAFKECQLLENIVIPNSVTNIELYAFQKCSSLSEVLIPDGVRYVGDYAFQDCTSLTNIVFPSGLETIGYGVCEGCDSLRYARIPQLLCEGNFSDVFDSSTVECVEIMPGVGNIAVWAFYSSETLKEIIIPNTVTNIGEYAFYECKLLSGISIPNSVKYIGGSAFGNCSMLTNAIISTELATIETGVFYGCNSLEYAKIPQLLCAHPDGYNIGNFFDVETLKCIEITSGVTNIGNYAFSSCYALESIVIPTTIKSIGDSAFSYCSSLTKILIPNNVEYIGEYALRGCASLDEIMLPQPVCTRIDYSSSFEWLFGYDGVSVRNLIIAPGVTNIGPQAFTSATTVENVIIPDSVKNIEWGAFAYCESLKNITIGCGVTTIGQAAFDGCSSLLNINIPDSVTSIADSAFMSCSLLTEVSVGCNVTSIGSYAFSYSNLKRINFNGNAPKSVATTAFKFVASDCIAYAMPNSTGWGVDIPGVWKGINIAYVAASNPFPELPTTATAAEVTAALEGSVDAKLAANITTAVEYAAYRAWALGLEGVTPQQVKDSAYSWLSYALNTDALIAAAPKEGDIVIDTFASAANAGTFEFAVKIDGIEVGENALEANIRKVFDIEGAETLANGGAGFSTDNVEVNTAAPESGNVKFTVTPKKGNGEKPDSFFFRVKMK